MIAIPLTPVVLFLLFLFLIAPKKRREMDDFKNKMYAHRGLHNGERAENSMSAFKAAVEKGYGIELDIRLSKDGQLVVFHDDTLGRVCGVEGKVIDFTAEELSRLSLNGTGEGIPLFADVLKMVDGRVPLLVEIKEDPGNKAVSLAACQMLSEYKGDYIVESFNPLSLRTVKKTDKKIVRGVLSEKFYQHKEYRKPMYMALQLLLLNFLARPAFIAFEHTHHSAFALRLCRGLFKVPTLAWTVRSAEDEAEARKNGFDGIIFENYLPNEK